MAPVLRIAGVDLVLDGGGAVVAERAAALRPFLPAARPADYTIRLAIEIGAPRGAGIRASAEGSEAFVYERPDLRFVMDRSRRSARVRIDESEGAFAAMLELALQTALLPTGGLVVHASAGVAQGGGWLLPGRSGAGKSTAVRNGGFDRVLSDEMVVLRRHEDGFQLWGTPFWSEDRPLPYDAGSAPLTLLGRLRKHPEVAVAPLDPDEAAAHLLACVTLYETTEAARRLAFELACDVACATRCVELSFPREGPWVPAATRILI